MFPNFTCTFYLFTNIHTFVNVHIVLYFPPGINAVKRLFHIGFSASKCCLGFHPWGVTDYVPNIVVLTVGGPGFSWGHIIRVMYINISTPKEADIRLSTHFDVCRGSTFCNIYTKSSLLWRPKTHRSPKRVIEMLCLCTGPRIWCYGPDYSPHDIKLLNVDLRCILIKHPHCKETRWPISTTLYVTRSKNRFDLDIWTI